MIRPVIRHGGLIAQRLGGRWKGVLIEGPSGSGKSDLALRGLAEGFHLVADDRTLLWTSGGRLFGRAPDTLRGLIEMRGLGVMRVEPVALAEIICLVRLGVPERLPPDHTENLLGVAIPHLEVAPFEAAAAAKLSRAIQTFDAAHNGRM